MSSTPSEPGGRRVSPAAVASGSVGFAVAIIVVALNLRPAVAGVGPVLNTLRHSLGLSSTGASVLTAAPVFAFGAVAPAGPWLARRIGLHRTIMVLIVLVLAGLVVRLGPDVGTLFTGTLIAASAIAAANVLLPVVIKRDFPARTGLLMGLYTTALVGSGAAAAGLSVPVGDAIGHGWRGELGIWALLAAVGVVMWAPYARHDTRVVAVAAPEESVARLRHDPLAWTVTLFFGLQSLSFYAVLSWLPSLYQDHGYSAGAAGGLLSLSGLVQIPAALVLPSIATRMARQEILVVGCVVFTAGGLAGILIAPTTVPALWVVILGIGQGSAFAVALSLLVLRTRAHGSTAQLSSMAQSIGYLIAGLGPLLVGALHATTNSWHDPFILLLVLLVPELVTGLRAAAPGYVRTTAT